MQVIDLFVVLHGHLPDDEFATTFHTSANSITFQACVYPAMSVSVEVCFQVS